MPKPICFLVNFFGLFRLWLGLGSFLDPLITFRVTAFNSRSSRGVLINHRTLNLLLLQHLRGNAKLVDPGGVHLVDVALVEEDEEDNVIPEAADAVHGWHLDDKSKDVIDEGVQSLVGHHPPRGGRRSSACS